MDFYRPPTTQGTIDALASISRAVRAWRFYPTGHPTRRNSLILSHSSLLQALDGNMFLLNCGRTGFSFPDGEHLKDAYGTSTALAYELFIRRVQKITFFHDLLQEDLLELIKILCLTPEEIQQSGGVDTIMAARGIRSIWVNEFDLTAIRGKRQKIEQAGTFPKGIDEDENVGDSATAAEQQPLQPETLSPEQQLQALLVRLTSCSDEAIYPRLLNLAIASAGGLNSRHEAHLLFQLLELLADHSSDEERSEEIRNCARFATEQLITSGELLQIVIEGTEGDSGVSKKALHAVLKAGGATAITAGIEFMGRTNSLKSRRTLSTMLGNMGNVAVPTLLNMMHDPRWFITRNICAILGAIASQETVASLTECLYHQDLRVRKEALRSLGLLGGHEAAEAILGILRGTDTVLYPQAIALLGAIKSRKALVELMNIVFSKDLFLKSLQLKIEALAAIALIGDRQATPHLVKLLKERHLLAGARGKLLKTAIAVCLGKLGDARALPALKKGASWGGEAGSACVDAITMIEKAEGIHNEIS